MSFPTSFTFGLCKAAKGHKKLSVAENAKVMLMVAESALQSFLPILPVSLVVKQCKGGGSKVPFHGP